MASEDEDQSTSPTVEEEFGGMHIKKQGSEVYRGKKSFAVEKWEDASDKIMTINLGSKAHSSHSPTTLESSSHSSAASTPRNDDMKVGSVTVKQQPGQPPKLSRNMSQKVPLRPPILFYDYPDKTNEATGTFQVIPGCVYSSKAIGATDVTEDVMECDCTEEWNATIGANLACGDIDCINRATRLECVGDCKCGPDCQNQRFQRRQYAKVTVIKTERKGYGLRADTDLRSHEFIFEYIGEVIGEHSFRRRMQQYDEEGIKHFYFMSLNKGEFVDATKKGNLGRFCNHSCNPNCYVDKWVVGDKLRMGIFADRPIKAGEELVFNYNVDRYGANPQPCYCGEPNCTGFIGGKTQTERATKLPQATIEALGIDDGDSWDTAVAKKPRKKKATEDDEEYVNNLEPKGLDEDGVTQVMATLMQCKEKWITVKLLGRIQRCEDERVRNRVVKMHGYQILNSVLALFKDDFNIALQILDILNHFPRLTRNKISDSKIEENIQQLCTCGDGRVEFQAGALLNEWSALEVAYRIPRMKRDPNAAGPLPKHDHFGRRDAGRGERKGRSRSRSPSKSRSRSRSLDAPRGPSASSGGRTIPHQRPNTFSHVPRPPFRNPLPPGWNVATSENGRKYYYSVTGTVTWDVPKTPAVVQAPPPPPKPISNNKLLEDIINDITNAKANSTKERSSASSTPQPAAVNGTKSLKTGKEKWRALPLDKQKRIYETTLSPHIQGVMYKYKNKLPREDLKRFAKQISKKLVDSDYKNHRVDDPNQISSSQERHVKKHVKEFFEKAVTRKKERDNKEAEKRAIAGPPPVQSATDMTTLSKQDDQSDGDGGMGLSEDELEKQEPDIVTPITSATPLTPANQLVNGESFKRKRNYEGDVSESEDADSPRGKRYQSDTPLPPPPPPPPMEIMAEVPSDATGTGFPYDVDDANQMISQQDLDNLVDPELPLAPLSEQKAAAYRNVGLIGTGLDKNSGSPSDEDMGSTGDGYGSMKELSLVIEPQVPQGR